MAYPDDVRVVTVIVTYFPDEAILKQLLDALLPQVAGVQIVDNGSPKDRLEWVLAARQPKLSVAFMGDNRGLGAAHNCGIAAARQQGATHVLLMDQDSVPAPDMVERLHEAWHDLSARGLRICAVGPCFIESRTGKPSYFVRMTGLLRTRKFCPLGYSGPLAADVLISSGSLIPMSVLDTVGPMDESLFIGHVDTEWYLRARAAGYRAYGICGAIMEHALGDQATTLAIGGGRMIPLYKPTRYYYIFRNTLLLWRKPYTPVAWMINDVVWLAKLFGYFTLMRAPRLRHAGMMVRGLWDGLLGRAGPLR